MENEKPFKLVSKYRPTGDQPEAIDQLVKGLENGVKEQVLMGVTGSGKTFTMANVIEQMNRPTLVLAHNKTLAAQLCSEFREFFPENAVEYFVSYYDYYQPEAYITAFRRIHTLFDSLNISNVAYVWQSTGGNSCMDELYQYYPGDEYVDWFAYSQFAQGRCQAMIDLARKHGKPLFIAESTPMFQEKGVVASELRLSNPEQANRAWSTWYKELFNTVESNPDVVKAFSYINADWPSEAMWQGDTVIFSKIDARLQINPDITVKWKEKMKMERYIHEPIAHIE